MIILKCLNDAKEKHKGKIDVLTGAEMGLLSRLKTPIDKFLIMAIITF